MFCHVLVGQPTGGASAVKEPGHFEVRKSSSQVTRMHFFPQKKLTPLTPFHCWNKTNKAVRNGNIFIFCSHYYRSKAIRRAWARAVDLPARSFDLMRPGVAPPLGQPKPQSHFCLCTVDCECSTCGSSTCSTTSSSSSLSSKHQKNWIAGKQFSRCFVSVHPCIAFVVFGIVQ